MNDATPDPRLGIGGNRPPDTDIEFINERLTEAYREEVKRAHDLIDALARVPAEITDDEINGRAGDFVKQVNSHLKELSNAHRKEKDPFLNAGRAVDGFFKKLSDALTKVKNTVVDRKTTYEREKAREERRRREEAERKVLEEAERARKEAEEAERKAQSETDLADAIDADERAAQAAADAEQARRAADAKVAELSATRSDLGSHSSLRAFWDCTIEDRATLDLEELRPFLKEDAMLQALKVWVKVHAPAHGQPAPKLKGARIFENTRSVTR